MISAHIDPSMDASAAVFAALKPKFVREDFDTIEPGDLQWVVKGLWPHSGVCFVAGPSMSGKSFWTLDKLAKVALGQPVLDRTSKPCGVVYVAAEGAFGAKKRIKALRDEIGPLGGRFEFIGQAPDLTDVADVDDLNDTLRDAKAAMQRRGHRLGIVAVDTLSASAPGADENTAKDMSPILAALHSMATDLEVLVIVVAHTGKVEERGIRGWSGLLANADGVITMDSPNGISRSGTITKVKDGEAGGRFGFELKNVVLSRDDDGEDVTTCLVIDTGAPISGKVSKRLTPKFDLVLRCFHMCIDDGEFVTIPAVNGVPPGTKGVERSVLRNRLLAMGYTAGTEKPDSVRKAMNRTIDLMIERILVRGNSDFVWAIV